MTDRFLIWGAGGQARVVLDVAKAVYTDFAFVGLASDDKVIHGYKVILESEIAIELMPSDRVLIGIGDNWLRQKIASELVPPQQVSAPVLSRHARLSDTVTVGSGTLVMPGVQVNTDSRIGQHCIINTGAIIEHDCQIDDFASVSPGAILCGGAIIGAGAMIGAGATVMEGLSIGAQARVGAGATVTRNVAAGETVFGTPARAKT